MNRCGWALSELAVQYHDQEWGVPLHEDSGLFAFLILEGAQAGLNWEIILRKRERYYQVYDNFDPQLVAHYKDEKIANLMAESGIIRNRRKIESSIRNAKIFLQIQAEYGSFDRYLWHFVNGQPVFNQFETLDEIPSQTPLSQTISLDLKKRGMNFVGPTIMYAYMQAVGLVNDHLLNCNRHQQIEGERLQRSS